MGSITTAMTTSSKAEYMAAGHCINSTVTPTANTHTSTTVDTVSAMAGVAVGMAVTGSGVPANSFVAAITSATAFVLSQATTTSLSGTTLTISGDPLFVALIAATPTGTYDATSTNYTNVTGNTDETTGTGYSAGGLLLTNVSPVTSGTTAYINFSPNPAWTGATFSTSGCLIYNSIARNGGTSGTNTAGAGRALGVFSFGGVQSVSSGVITLLMPVAAASTAVLRIT